MDEGIPEFPTYPPPPVPQGIPVAHPKQAAPLKKLMQRMLTPKRTTVPIRHHSKPKTQTQRKPYREGKFY